MLPQLKWPRKVHEMKKASEVFSKIRFAKLDPKHEKAGPTSTDDEEHYTVGEKEFEQQLKHAKKRAMQEQNDVVEKNEMAQTQLHFIKYAAEEILEYMDMGGEIEEWYQNKLSKVQSEVESLHSYIEGEKRRTGMVKEEQIDEVSSTLVGKARDVAFAKGKEDQAFRFVRKHYEKQKKESDALGKKMAEEVEQLDEKNIPTSPEKWAQAKAQAKAKFDVYPSAYANGWAAKKYKAMGGGWKSVSEETKPPFEGGTKPKEKAIAGKYGKQYSTVRHLARQAMQKQVEKMKKAPIKEESRKAAIVKDIMKKKPEPEDKFQASPTLTSQVQKVDNAVT